MGGGRKGGGAMDMELDLLILGESLLESLVLLLEGGTSLLHDAQLPLSLHLLLLRLRTRLANGVVVAGSLQLVCRIRLDLFGLDLVATSLRLRLVLLEGLSRVLSGVAVDGRGEDVTGGGGDGRGRLLLVSAVLVLIRLTLHFRHHRRSLGLVHRVGVEVGRVVAAPVSSTVVGVGDVVIEGLLVLNLLLVELGSLLLLRWLLSIHLRLVLEGPIAFHILKHVVCEINWSLKHVLHLLCVDLLERIHGLSRFLSTIHLIIVVVVAGVVVRVKAHSVTENHDWIDVEKIRGEGLRETTQNRLLGNEQRGIYTRQF
ncbi:hypothetical protein PMAYCL1PPCAC_02922 [Pristionchus mayeri]|uniref:Uncharacterized protein n=1 Tax=Pristionchus mayeri TaxID=1317129 RepID=A0AAN4Z7F4_9BILA|nr:hypothetical protein PMAYCL1PPCAC_02922 [Pristionchus mayeri]